MASRLPTIEIGASFVIWISSVFYAIFKFYKSCDFYKSHKDYYDDFKIGWPMIGRNKDNADFEWRRVLQLIESISPWICIHIIITIIIKKLSLKLLPIFHTLLSIAFIILTINCSILPLLLFQPFLFELCSKIKNKYSIWICCIFSILIVSYFKELQSEYVSYYFQLNELSYFKSVVAAFWINLKCVSFYLDKITKQDDRSMLELIPYCFYLPTLFMGPFISYDDYKNCLTQIQLQNLSNRSFKLLKNIVRLMFWLLFAEWILHYIYISATVYQLKFIESMDTWTLYGYGYTMGQFFHVKYLVIYGLSCSIGEFEGISIPSAPKCIGRIHLYKDMWRYFDNGLYKFLFKYIYIPTMIKKTFINSILSSFLCFAFIYIWHGWQNFILIWSCLNYIVITIEKGWMHFYGKYLAEFTVKYIGGCWERRLGALLNAPVLAISIISNFYFFAGITIGNIFMTRFLSDTPLSTVIIIIILYNFSQAAIEIVHWERKQKEHIKTR